MNGVDSINRAKTEDIYKRRILKTENVDKLPLENFLQSKPFTIILGSNVSLSDPICNLANCSIR